MANSRYQGAFFLVSFSFVIFLCWLMFRPMLHPLIFGGMLAGISFPLKDKLTAKYKLKNEYSSSITLALVIFLCILPLIYISFEMTKELIGLIGLLKSESISELNDGLFQSEYLQGALSYLNETFNLELSVSSLKTSIFTYGQTIGAEVLKTTNSIVGDVLSFLFDLVIMLIFTYALLVWGSELKDYAFKLSPLSLDQEERLLKKFNQMNYVTFVCNGVGGIIQGFLAGIALWICGFDSIFLWTLVMTILAFIPLVGISIVTFPAFIILLAKGDIAYGIFLFVWTTLVSLVVENWFKPIFIGQRIKINSVLVLLSIIGAMKTWGVAGIFYGPVLAIVFITFAELYIEREESALESGGSDT